MLLEEVTAVRERLDEVQDEVQSGLRKRRGAEQAGEQYAKLQQDQAVLDEELRALRQNVPQLRQERDGLEERANSLARVREELQPRRVALEESLRRDEARHNELALVELPRSRKAAEEASRRERVLLERVKENEDYVRQLTLELEQLVGDKEKIVAESEEKLTPAKGKTQKDGKGRKGDAQRLATQTKA